MLTEEEFRQAIAAWNGMEGHMTVTVKELTTIEDVPVAWIEVTSDDNLLGRRTLCGCELKSAGVPPNVNMLSEPKTNCNTIRFWKLKRLADVHAQAAALPAVSVWREADCGGHMKRLISVLALRMYLGEFVGTRTAGSISIPDLLHYLDIGGAKAAKEICLYLQGTCVLGYYGDDSWRPESTRMEEFIQDGLLHMASPAQ